MQEDMFPIVIQAAAGSDYTVFAYMLDGTIRRVSVKHLIDKGGVWKRLKDPDFFCNALTVMNDTVAWDLSGCLDPTNCIDIDPFTIAECEIVSDPLHAATLLTIGQKQSII